MSRQSKARRPLVAGLAGAQCWSERLTGKRFRVVRLTAALAAFGLVVSGTIGSTAAQAAPDVVYDAIGAALPSNVTSQPFQAQQVDEFGDLVTLAPGPRELTTVSVVLSSWACGSGTGPTCVTTAGATFDHPLTMTLYNVAGTPAAPTVGSVITTLTDTFTIPFRPSADLVNCTGTDAGKWFDGTTCQNGIAAVVDFEFPAGTILPDTLIWGIAYNTSSSGYAPIGVPGPYDSLNVGAFTINPTVGTDVNEDMAFINYPATGAYASELGWTGFRPMARIEAQVPPPPPSAAAAPYEALGGVVVGSPAAASWEAGRLDVVVRGSDNQLWRKWYDGGWSTWEPLGGTATAGPAVASWSAGRLDVFARGTDDQLWHKWYDGSWSNWEPLGGVVADSPAAASWEAGRLDVVVRGSDNQLWHKWYDGAWSTWEPLGGQITTGPAVATWSAGRLDVFARGTDDQLWHKWYDGAWSGWEPLGGVVADSPAAASWEAGRLDIVVRGSDNQPWRKWYDGAWSTWEPLGGQITAGPGAASWSAGRLDIFVNGTDHQLWHKWHDGGLWF